MSESVRKFETNIGRQNLLEVEKYIIKPAEIFSKSRSEEEYKDIRNITSKKKLSRYSMK